MTYDPCEDIVFNDEDGTDFTCQKWEADVDPRDAYAENGIYIQVSYHSVYLATDKYSIYWQDNDENSLTIRNKKKFTGAISSHYIIFDGSREFDIQIFAIVKDPKVFMSDLQVIWSSAEIVDSQVEKIMSCQPVKRIPDLGVFA